MRTPKNDHPHFETEVNYPGVKVEHEEVDINILDFWKEPTLPRSGNNYEWDWHVSMSIDRAEDTEEKFDGITVYLNGDLKMQGEKYFIIKINTLHCYQITPVEYKLEHKELFKAIARESVLHANLLLDRDAKGTAYEGLHLPPLDEDFLDEDATEWNKHGYLPRASQPDKNALGRKMNKKELDELVEKANKLVKWIDDFDETDHEKRTQDEMDEYYVKWAEWSKLNKQLWHFKLIARNQIAYLLNKMMVGMEKQLDKTPDNYDLHEMYDDMRENYLVIMNELKNEFAKN